MDDQHIAKLDHTSVLRRCGTCDVTWRGTAAIACWFCGAPGVAGTDIRIVEDEPAA